MKQIIDYIRSDAGKNFKINAIKEHSNNVLFKQLLLNTYSPLIRYGVSLNQIPDYTPGEAVMTLEEAVTEMEKLSSRKLVL